MVNICNTLRLKNANRRQTRDLLLPKLISGELDVSDLDIDIPESEYTQNGGSCGEGRIRGDFSNR